MGVERAAPRRLPPYSYVPGLRPHPTRHPEGHSYGCDEPSAGPLDPHAWWEHAPYVRGLELFDHGYYWEAHEAWEGPWRAAERGSALSELLGGLIGLAAAGVKIRQGRGGAAARLAMRAQERVERAQGLCGNERLAGLAFAELTAFAEHVRQVAPGLEVSPERAVAVVFGRRLAPSGSELAERQRER